MKQLAARVPHQLHELGAGVQELLIGIQGFDPGAEAPEQLHQPSRALITVDLVVHGTPPACFVHENTPGTTALRNDPAHLHCYAETSNLTSKESLEMGKKKPAANKAGPTVLDQARDELFSHILRCGVLEADAEHQKEWFDDTMDYLSERYESLADEELSGLRRLGEQYCRPVIQRQESLS